MITKHQVGSIALPNILATGVGAMTAQSPRKILIAHRGASAYAPEHTLAAYRLALEQGADFVEQDLQISGDGVLVCIHDPVLERTTNVEELYPDRATMVTWEGKTTRSWFVNDFTLWRADAAPPGRAVRKPLLDRSYR